MPARLGVLVAARSGMSRPGQCVGDLGARVEVKAGQDLAQVELDGLHADVELGGDLAIGLFLGK